MGKFQKSLEFALYQFRKHGYNQKKREGSSLHLRRRIFLYNTIVVTVALVALLAVAGGVLRWTEHGFSGGPPRGESAGDAAQVQELLNQWQITDDWQTLDQQLQEYGYSLHVAQGEQEVYSSLNPIQQEVLRDSAGGDSWPEESALAVRGNGALLVGLRREGYTIVAMPQPDMPVIFGRPRLQREAVMIVFLASGLTAIGVIVLLSLVFTHFQARQILRPVGELTRAALRVERGDYSKAVEYDQRDDFAPVCIAFNHMQRHLLEEREKNAAYEQARTDLVAGISHDLRTPLTSVKGYIKGLRDGVAKTPERRAEYLDIAYRKACDMDILLQRLFYFSKLETGNLPLFPEVADLGKFVSNFAGEAEGELAQKGGSLTLQIQPGAHPVRIDTEQMYRVLTNLTDNALRYAGARPLRLSLTVERQGDRECLRFADNGGGVAEEQLPHLFEQFWRGDQARGSRGGEGSGLGLYIVKYIMEAHGGQVTARNEGGLVFELTLPREEEEA